MKYNKQKIKTTKNKIYNNNELIFEKRNNNNKKPIHNGPKH